MTSYRILFDSADRAAASYTAGIGNEGFAGCHVIADLTAGAGSVVVHIEALDPATGNYYPLLTSASLSGSGTTVLRVHPFLTAAANTVAQDGLPEKTRVRAVVSGGNLTFSVGCNLVD